MSGPGATPALGAVPDICLVARDAAAALGGLRPHDWLVAACLLSTPPLTLNYRTSRAFE